MKRKFPLAVLLVAPVLLFAWGGSVSTSWNGSMWVDGSTVVLAETSTAYLTICSPTAVEAGVSCPGPYNWTSKAKFERPAELFRVQKLCGGNNTDGPFTLGSTGNNYSLSAQMVVQTGYPEPPQSAGPVTAIVTGSGPTYCRDN